MDNVKGYFLQKGIKKDLGVFQDFEWIVKE